MEQESKRPVPLSRRTFLGGTALLAGAAAVGAAGVAGNSGLACAEPTASGTAEEVKINYCRGNCGANMCHWDVHVREGKVVAMKPHVHADADPVTKGRSKGCLRGMSMMETLYNERRVKYPMRRAEGTPRGGGEWERISWDDALNEIVQKWGGYIQEFGGKSIVRWSVYGSTVTLNSSYGSWPRLCTILGISS